MRNQWIIALLICANLFGQSGDSQFFDDIAVPFAGKRGQVEVGGNFAGAAFHHSRPLPSRISFFYPVANSLDLIRITGNATNRSLFVRRSAPTGNSGSSKTFRFPIDTRRLRRFFRSNWAICRCRSNINFARIFPR
ncbi:MAG: hypothetical protein R3C26_09140 [Calditrichia bacterium]